MKSQITYEAKINEENQNILSLKTNTQNSAEEEGISHCIFRLLHFKLKFMCKILKRIFCYRSYVTWQKNITQKSQ